MKVSSKTHVDAYISIRWPCGYVYEKLAKQRS